MKYFIDTEFIEGFHKPLFGKKRHFIDLISIGIVAEDGRNFYAISNEYNYKDADEWVQKNVIVPMYIKEISGDKRNHIDAEHFHKCIPNGKSNKQIAEEIMMFLYPEQSKGFKGAEAEFLQRGQRYGWNGEQPEFYGYYADYDWVLLCSLFGRMIDLPKGFPMYCRDLKQMLDEKAESLSYEQLSKLAYDPSIVKHNVYSYLESVKENKSELIKNAKSYPKQTNEHNALSDAKWNYELYKFLNA